MGLQVVRLSGSHQKEGVFSLVEKEVYFDELVQGMVPLGTNRLIPVLGMLMFLPRQPEVPLCWQRGSMTHVKPHID